MLLFLLQVEIPRFFPLARHVVGIDGVVAWTHHFERFVRIVVTIFRDFVVKKNKMAV